MKGLLFTLLVIFHFVNVQGGQSPDAFRDVADTQIVQHQKEAQALTECSDPLGCWLEELTFQIPDTCFEVMHVDCCITEFICSGIALGNIDSLYTYPTSLYMSVQDLGTSCAGNWKYGVLGGTLTAAMSQIDVATTAEFPKEDIYATALTFPSCDIPSIEIELSFSGGLVGAVLDLISGAVERGLEKAVYTVVCEKAEGALASKVTEALVSIINPAVAEVVAAQPSLPVPAEELPADTYLDYTTSLPGMLGQLEASLGDDYLNQLVDHFTGGTGLVQLDLGDLTLHKQIVDPTSGPLANVTLIFHELRLAGLDSFSNISLLTASPPSSPVYSPYSVAASLSLASLKATLDMTVDIELDQMAVGGSSLVERFALELDLSDVTLGAELFAPLHLARLGGLFLDQTTDLSCLLGSLDYLSLSSLVAHMKVDVVSITPLGEDVDPESLEADIDKLINDVLLVGFSGFPELVTGVIQGLAQGTIRESLNVQLAQSLALAPASCPAHQVPAPDAAPVYLEWAQSPLLSLLDKVLNEAIGFSGVNKLIDSLTGGTGKASFELSKVALEFFNLDSFYQLALLTPSAASPYSLDSVVGAGYCKGHGGSPQHKELCSPLGLSVTPLSVSEGALLSSIRDAALHLLDEDSLAGGEPMELLFANATALLSVLTELDLTKLAGLQVNQLPLFAGDVTARNGCLLGVLDQVAVQTLSLTLAEASLQKGALAKKDILAPVQQLLDALGSDKVLGGVNTLLQAVLDTAEEACETGEWPAPPSPDDDDDDISPVCDSPISCLLNHLVIGPSEEACLDVQGVQVCVGALQCYNMDLEGLPSVLVDLHTVSLGLTSLDMTCSASYSLSLAGGYELYAGGVKVKLGDFTTSIDVKLEGSQASSKYPSYLNGVDLSQCQVQDGYSFEVTFQGGALGSILNQAVAPALEALVVQDLSWLLCYVLAPPLSRVMTKVIRDKVDPVLLSVMDTGAAPVPPVQEAGMVAWNTSVLEKVYDLLDALVVKKQDGGGVGNTLSCLLEGAQASSTSTEGLSVPSATLWGLLPEDVRLPGITVDIGAVVPLPMSGNSTGSVTIETLSITGLRTLHDVVLLKPSATSSVTLTTALGLTSLDLQLAVMVNLDDSADTSTSDGFGVYQQELIVDLSLSDCSLELDLVLAMQEAVLGALYLDQALDLGCLLSSVADLRVSSLVLDLLVDNFSVKQVRRGDAGVLEKDTVALLDNAVAVLVDGFPAMLSAVIKGVFQGPIKAGVNEGLARVAQEWQATHPCGAHVDHHANSTDPAPVLWAESPVILALDKVLNDLMGPSGLNKILTCATNSTGEVLLHIPPTSPLLAGWTIGLEGLNSFYEFALLYPVESEQCDLGNKLGLGSCTNPEDASNYNPVNDPQNHGSSCSPFALTISGLEPDGRPVAIAISLENLYLYLDLLLELNQKAFADLQISQLSQEGCLMSTLTEMGVRDLLLSASDVEMFFNNGEGDVDLTAVVTSLLASISSPETLQSINTKMADALTTATEKCAGTYVPLDGGGDTPSSSSGSGLSDWKWQLGLVLGSCFVAVCVLLWIYNHYGTTSSKNRARDSYDYDGSSADDNGETNSQSMYEYGAWFSNEWFTEKLGALFGWTEGDFHYDALLGQEKIPVYVRLLMPLALMGNIALFINANLVTGASVMVEMDLGDMVVKPDPVFEFGLANTVNDMWEAGVYPLSILVAFFSGAWPYIKLVAMLMCWVLPTSAMPLRNRDSVLRWLDILGKWSLLDTYVMVMMMVAFNFTLVVAPGIEVIVFVVPNWGFYGFLLATMTSLGLGHLVLACHRLVSEPKVPSDDEAAEAIMNHSFSVEVSQRSVELSSFSTDETMSSEGHKLSGFVWKQRRVAFTSFGKAFVVALLSASILAMIVGTFMDTFQFEFRGLTGYLMDPDSREMPYGLVSIGNVLPEASGSPKDFGIRWIQASYFAFGLAMPLAFLVALLLLWITPLTLRLQKFCVVMTEVLNAWNALDVFVVSIVAALMEIQQFASFIVGDSCDLVNEVLKENMDSELEGDDKCFDVVATLKLSAVYLYLSAFLLVVVGLIMLRIFLSAVSERVESFQHKQLADEFACLSQDGRCASSSTRASEASHGVYEDLSGRSTINTQSFASLSRTVGHHASSSSLQGDAENNDRTRVDTVDLTHECSADEQQPLQYQAPDYSGPGSSAYDKDIDHAASVLTNKSKSNSSTRPATLAQVLSNGSRPSEGGTGGGQGQQSQERGRGTQMISFSIKAARFLGLVTISTDDDEDHDNEQ